MDEGDSPRPSFLKRFWQRFFSRRVIDHPDDLEREIGNILEICEEKELLSSQERELIESIIEFKDTLVREIMVPRTEIIAVEHDTPMEEIFRMVVESGHSRFPVYEDTIDNIVGLLLAKDLLTFCQAPEVQLDLGQVLRPVYFIPESKKISDLLRDLVERKAQISIVIDEYGGTAGLITLEDILEEIVGEIYDEYDRLEPRLISQDDGSVVVDARLDVEELMEHFDRPRPEGKFESVGGLLIHLLGRVPQINDTVVINDLELTVKSADERRAKEVLVRPISSEESPADQV
jgi:CBS domain containing-hemolysin-like protein